MKWISVSDRVPDNRRRIITWGTGGWIGLSAREQFLGDTRFNPAKDGGKFDIELSRRFTWCRVTHWAEIEAPADRLPVDSCK